MKKLFDRSKGWSMVDKAKLIGIPVLMAVGVSLVAHYIPADDKSNPYYDFYASLLAASPFFIFFTGLLAAILLLFFKPKRNNG